MTPRCACAQVNFDILWAIVRDDLPPLVAELEKIVGSDQAQG